MSEFTFEHGGSRWFVNPHYRTVTSTGGFRGKYEVDANMFQFDNNIPVAVRRTIIDHIVFGGK